MTEAYVAYNNNEEIRLKSSSGGIFYSLAEYILTNNGIVFGAAWNKDWLVDMCYVDNLNDLPKLMGSKYVKANNKDTFNECKEFLDSGKLILYTGTPCQIMALKKKLNKDYNNLYTISIACYGTTPIQIWKDYLNSISRPNCKIIDIKMRDKTNANWNNYNYVIEYSDGKKLVENHLNNKYSKVFISANYFNKSCYNCRAKENLFSDISLGDYWGVQNKFSNIKADKGVSFILTNTEKGRKLLNIINNIHIEKTDIEHIKKFNKGIQSNLGKSALTYNKDIFNKKVAIITMNMHFNVGTALQAYALQTVLKEKGYDSDVITWERKDRLKFCDKYIKMRILPSSQDYNTIKENEYDIFIVGSDQIWRKNTSLNDYKNNYINYPFLAFTKNWNKVRFSYAPSFGMSGENWPYTKDEDIEINKLLRQFNSLSVREIDSILDMNNKLKLNSIQLCDPTMLLSKNYYMELCKNIDNSNIGIFKYFLHETLDKKEFVNNVSKDLKLDITTHDKSSVIDWLSKIRDSKLIITDSFHGVVFSIIFNKPFLFYNNRDCGKSRFDTLDILFNIKSKLIDKNFKIDENIFKPLNIDLNNIKLKASKFLDDNLHDVPKYLNIDVNYSDKKIDIINKQNWQKDNKHAWVLFLSTDNYIYYVLNVYKNLMDSKTKYAVCCACTENISKKTLDILDKCGIIVFKINSKNIANNIKVRQIRNWMKAFPKLEILRNPLNLEKMVYLDSDLGIYENIDELMLKEHMSAVIDGAPYFNFKKGDQYNIGDSRFCSGLFIWDFTTNNDNIALLNSLKDLPTNIKWHDQNVLNYFYKDWMDKTELHLDYTYGLQTTNDKFNRLNLKKGKNWPKVIHYIAGQGEKTKIPFINEKMYLQSWCSMQEIIDYYKDINESIKFLIKEYRIDLKLLDTNNIILWKDKRGYRPHVVVKESTAFTGLPEEWWKEDF